VGVKSVKMTHEYMYLGTGKRGRPAKNAAPKEESPAEESAEEAE